MKLCPQCKTEPLPTPRATVCATCSHTNRSEGAKKGVAVRMERQKREMEEGVKRKKEEWRKGPRKPTFAKFGLFGWLPILCLAILRNDITLSSLGFSKPSCEAYNNIKRAEIAARGK